MTILVTGATGQLGRLVVEALLARGVDPGSIAAGARRPEKLGDLESRGVRVVRLDYDDPVSIDSALSGAQRLLLVSGSEVGKRIPQHRAVIEGAKRAGVELLAYTSLPQAELSTLPLAVEHRGTEEALRASGVPYVLLRNNWYSENYRRELAQARATGELVSSLGDGRAAPASRADFAEAAAVVLTTDGHEGKVYELGGDVALGYEEVAAILSELLGREIVYRRLTPEEQRAVLLAAGMPEGQADFVAGIDAGIREGWLATVTNDLSRLIGRPTTPLIEVLRAAL